ncbi:hypothetical protein C8R44DRAFT_736117 [Mycena epipterygia]|nr:hypothetical protein C8R44DRAFT_736117 [Mycena epipterygia]
MVNVASSLILLRMIIEIGMRSRDVQVVSCPGCNEMESIRGYFDHGLVSTVKRQQFWSDDSARLSLRDRTGGLAPDLPLGSSSKRVQCGVLFSFGGKVKAKMIRKVAGAGAGSEARGKKEDGHGGVKISEIGICSDPGTAIWLFLVNKGQYQQRGFFLASSSQWYSHLALAVGTQDRPLNWFCLLLQHHSPRAVLAWRKRKQKNCNLKGGRRTPKLKSLAESAGTIELGAVGPRPYVSFFRNLTPTCIHCEA